MSNSSLSSFAFKPVVVALACGAGAQVTHAQSAQAPTRLSDITVTAPGIKPERSASVKLPVPLLDTPQTVTVIPKEVMEEQNVHSLKRVLQNVPGITFNAGEGRGGMGDNISVRGFSGNSNMQVDGLRDSAQTTRSDLFNMEAVEVTKGSNSTVGGAGTTGGTINMVSKQPRAESFTEIGAGLGTDSYKRATLDTNQVLGANQNVAVRLNLMVHDSDVSERDQIFRKRWGVAPSVTFGLGTPTSVTLSYLHQYDHNLPDYGVPARDGKALPGIARNKYHGWRNLEKEKNHTDVVTLKLVHAFSDAVSVQNLSRYSHVRHDMVISNTGVNIIGLPPGRYVPVAPQAFARDATTNMWTNQTNLSLEFETGAVKHVMATGFEISREELERDDYDWSVGGYPANGYDLYNPPVYWNGPIAKSAVTPTRTKLDTKAIYALDTLSFGAHWDWNVGLRYDWIDGERQQGMTAAESASTNKLSWRTGLVYKPNDIGRFYAAYGTSFNPSAENLVGIGFYAGPANFQPEKNRTMEVGTKWDVLDKRLALTAALFRVEKTHARETNTFDGTPILAGKQRVQGLELGVAGNITPQWDIYGGYAWMKSKTVRSVQFPLRVGNALPNTPEHSLSLWTGYTLPMGLKVSYGARYVGSRFVDSDNTNQAKIDSYLVHSLMASYKVNSNLNVQLNIDNLANKTYVETVRTGVGTPGRSSTVEYGDGRSVVLSANYRF